MQANPRDVGIIRQRHALIVREEPELLGLALAVVKHHRPLPPTLLIMIEFAEIGDNVLPWTGAGGARGEVRLRLLSSGVLEVSWAANQMGDNLGLISGTAALVRKLE